MVVDVLGIGGTGWSSGVDRAIGITDKGSAIARRIPGPGHIRHVMAIRPRQDYLYIGIGALRVIVRFSDFAEQHRHLR